MPDEAAERQADATETKEEKPAASVGERSEPKKKEKKDKGEKKGKGKGKNKDGKGKGWEFSGPTGSGQGYRLNVKNLSSETTTKEQLKKLFEPFGTVNGAEVKARDDGSSRGFGFVILSNEEEANKAIAELNGKKIGGKELNVGPAERRATEGDDDVGKGKGKGNGKNAGMDFATQQAFMMQYWAMQQAFMAQSLQQGMWPPGAWSGDSSAGGAGEYEGSLKSISEKNGYGFICCAETFNIYKRDVYIDKELLPAGAKPTDRLRFAVVTNNKGHPKAATAQLVQY